MSFSDFEVDRLIWGSIERLIDSPRAFGIVSVSLFLPKLRRIQCDEIKGIELTTMGVFIIGKIGNFPLLSLTLILTAFSRIAAAGLIAGNSREISNVAVN